MQLLRFIHDFPPELDGDFAEESAMRYTGDPDYVYMISSDIHKVISDPVWKFLDSLTWPEYMRRLMAATQYSMGGGVNILEWLGKKEWHHLPLSAKIASLHFLIDLIFSAPVARVMIDGWEEQLRVGFATEKEELAAKKKAMTKLARRCAKGGRRDSAGDSDDSEEGNDMRLPVEYDHLFVRDFAVILFKVIQPIA